MVRGSAPSVATNSAVRSELRSSRNDSRSRAIPKTYLSGRTMTAKHALARIPRVQHAGLVDQRFVGSEGWRVAEREHEWSRRPESFPISSSSAGASGPRNISMKRSPIRSSSRTDAPSARRTSRVRGNSAPAPGSGFARGVLGDNSGGEIGNERLANGDGRRRPHLFSESEIAAPRGLDVELADHLAKFFRDRDKLTNMRFSLGLVARQQEFRQVAVQDHIHLPREIGRIANPPSRGPAP